jgi:hypothetical protein
VGFALLSVVLAIFLSCSLVMCFSIIYLFQVIESIVGDRFAMTQEWEPLP